MTKNLNPMTALNIDATAADKRAESRAFLVSLNYFRAIAIVLIVTGHFLDIVNLDNNDFSTRLINNLIRGKTFLFVFISGFLFHFIFFGKRSYKKFILGKVKNVLAPYTLLSIPAIAYCIFIRQDDFGGYFLPRGEGLIEEYVVPFLKYYQTGWALTAYWYIPFIMVMFFLAPLHNAFIRLARTPQLVIMLSLFAVALFMHRPLGNLWVLQSIVYFSPVYLMGIMCSINREKIYTSLQNKEFLLLSCALGFAILQTLTSDTVGTYYKEPFGYNGIDLMLCQNFFFCLFFMAWLHRFEGTRHRFLEILAATSFTIFFMHPYCLMIVKKSIAALSIDLAYPWIALALFVSAVIGMCAAGALLMKKVMPKYSRYLTGY